MTSRGCSGGIRLRWFVRRVLYSMLMMALALAAGHERLYASVDENHLEEIMAGANGDSRVQFIVVRTEPFGNCWGPQGGELQSRAMLVFEDALGRETGRFKFPNNPGN